MKNKFLILTLLTTTALATNARAQTWDCSPTNAPGTCTATLDANGKMTISGTGPMRNDWSSQTSVPWYSKMSSIKSLDVQEGITQVGQFTFYGASNLETVSFPNSLQGWGIATGSFKNCSKLSSITFPETLTSFTGSSFFGLTGLTGELVIPDSVFRIGDYAFSGASGVTGKLIVPDSTTRIEEKAFRYMSGLTSLVVGDNVSLIGNDAFLGVSATIFCPSGVTCSGKGNTGQILTYTKDENGVYRVGNAYYASAEDMSNVVNGTLSPVACSNYDSCVVAAAAYKEAKIDKMVESGVLCQTRTGCLKLMAMVEDPNVVCVSGRVNNLSDCMTYGKKNNMTFDDPDPVSNNQSGNGSGQSAHNGKRIYTVEEARQAVEAAGTDTVSFRIRYK